MGREALVGMRDAIGRDPESTSVNPTYFFVSAGLSGFADCRAERGDAFVEGGGDLENGDFADLALELFEVLLRRRLVHFVGDDNARFVEHGGVVEFEFLEEAVE